MKSFSQFGPTISWIDFFGPYTEEPSRHVSLATFPKDFVLLSGFLEVPIPDCVREEVAKQNFVFLFLDGEFSKFKFQLFRLHKLK